MLKLAFLANIAMANFSLTCAAVVFFVGFFFNS